MNKVKIKSCYSRIVLMIVVFINITACDSGGGIPEEYEHLKDKSKRELIDVVINLADVAYELESKIAEKDALLKGIQSVVKEEPTIKEIEDGTGRWIFTRVDDKIVFNNPLRYADDAVMPVVDSFISVGDILKIPVNSNWTIKSNSGIIEIESVGGILAKFIVSSVSGTPTIDSIEGELNKFIEGLPSGEADEYKVYINDDIRGYGYKTVIPVDDGVVSIDFGSFGTMSNGVSYMFIYSGKRNTVNDELIQMLLDRCLFLNYSIKVV